ncbi:hypothetical protein TNIN_351211 [Trichonephila inaurata madagascariensis]|uniref:Uncharacterized protein n=1 Tax=Trichonephila inaurata madagascariensis TaxID=2747483 RepID=A0A8X6WSZ8_9ARAC|nr:hypothetical protein TNIN_351211 [Trichonephila inaurata madagascariensis]
MRKSVRASTPPPKSNLPTLGMRLHCSRPFHLGQTDFEGKVNGFEGDRERKKVSNARRKRRRMLLPRNNNGTAELIYRAEISGGSSDKNKIFRHLWKHGACDREGGSCRPPRGDVEVRP